MDKKERKYLCSIFLVIILLVCYGWYRSENGKIAQIEKLNDKIAEYENRIDQLELVNRTLVKQLENYTGDN